VKIRFKKPIYDYRDIDWESIEIEILWKKAVYGFSIDCSFYY
jgi:hypothetical protein